MRPLAVLLLAALLVPLAPAAHAEACVLRDVTDETALAYATCQAERAECAARAVLDATLECTL